MAPLADQFLQRRAIVEARLAHHCPRAKQEHGIGAAVCHSLLAPAKRVRGIMTLTMTGALGGNEAASVDAACALEMIHAASLILDDLPSMDNAEMRRGQPANHRVFGEATAILAAISLLNEAYGVIAKAPDLTDARRVAVADSLTRAVGLDGLVKGQFDDLGASRADMTESELERMYARKTGALFASAAECGSLIAGRDTLQGAMYDFGLNLGVGFQILDDVLDAAGKAENTGKDVSIDGFRKTFVTIMGARSAAAYGRKKIENAVAKAEEAARGLATPGQFAMFASKVAGSFASIVPELSSELAIYNQ